MPRSALLRVVAPLSLFAACATAPSSPSALARTAARYGPLQPGLRSSSDYVSQSEIALDHSGGTAYEALLHLRPQFFTMRTLAFGDDPYRGRPVVYLDGLRLGGLDELRTISANMLGEVRYLTPVIGSERFGRYYPGGVIAVESHR